MMDLADFKVKAAGDWEEPGANISHLLTLCSGLRLLTEPSSSSALFLTKHDIVQASNPAEAKKWNVNCIKSLNAHSHTLTITTSLTDRGHQERKELDHAGTCFPYGVHTVQGTNVKTVPDP